MIPPALSLFILRKLPVSRFDFPRWQSVLAISLIGLLRGLDPDLRTAPPDMSAPPLWLNLVMGPLTTWVAFLITLGMLALWLKLGRRWDGQGSLFNLVAASWLMAGVLGTGLAALGAPDLLTHLLWLYSVWVGANAVSGAIPKARLGYAIIGFLIGLVLGWMAHLLLYALAGFMLVLLGVVPPLPGQD